MKSYLTKISLIITRRRSHFNRHCGIIAAAVLTSLLGATTTQAALLLTDDMTGYTVAANLDGQGSWTKGGSGPSCTVQNATPLTYPGYNGGGGNYVQMGAPGGTTSRAYKSFTSTASVGNTFYASFLIRLNATTATGDYFITLGDPSTGTTYGPRLFAKTSGGGFVLGISKLSNTAVYGTTVFSLNTTYLVVVRYTGITGAANDTAYVWVNPVLTSEPTIETAECAADSTAGDAASSVGNFLWHNRSANNPSGAFDGVRVAAAASSAAAWSDLAALSCITPTAFNVTGGGSYCAEDSGVVIGLENSEPGVDYQLFRSGGTIAVGPVISGTGSAISFGDQAVADTYTVIATNVAGNCTADMLGQATVTVDPLVTPSVTVSANPGTTTCAGNQVIFTATPVNGGGSPSFVWKTNGVQDTSVPATSATYTNSNLSHDETVDCELTTSLTCVTAATVDAPQLTMTISGSVTPSVSVSANPGTTICAGTQVIFTALPVNGGGSPLYVWKTNGVQDTSVPASSATYTNSTLVSTDTIDCQLISNDPCASPTVTDAAQVVMTVNPTVTPSVTVVADPGSTVCANASVTFTATPVNGGLTPAYQWNTNGVPVTGATASTFATTNLRQDDVVTVVMTPSSEICVSPASATSDGIAMTINPLPTIALSVNPVVCVGTTSADLAYSAATGSPDQYSIAFDAAAYTAGFVDVPMTSLPASPIIVGVPAAAAPGIYQGTIVVNNSSAGCSGSGAAFTVTVSGPPSSTITAPGGVCADSSGNIASVPNVGGAASGASYAWTISGGTITSAEPQTNRVTFTAGASGTVVLGCSVISSNGCESVAAGSATVVINSSTLTPWVMASGDYFENFTDVANWKDGFTCGQGANHWSAVTVNATGTIPDGQRTTVSTATFQNASASAGVQRDNLGANPPGKLVLLTTGTTDHTTALAIDLQLDFTGRNAGTLSFDWAQVNNGGATDNRAASIRVYTSVDGTTFTELTGAAVLNVINNSGASGSIASIALPSTFDNSATARIRFYYYNGDGGSTGSRPKIALDNVAVTSACPAPLATIPTTPDPTVCAGTSVTLTETVSGGLPPFTYQWKKGGSPISDATNSTYTLAAAAVDDSGAYACEVTSSCGTSAISPELVLAVNPLPVVTISPATTNAECAATITFTANVSGDEPLAYQWFDNLTNAIPNQTNAMLTLDNVHGAAAGNYTVLVTGPWCGATAVATLTVADTVAPAITLLGANPATNECHVAYTDPGASAMDACAGIVAVTTNSNVDANVPGVYSITYTADDGSGNTNTATRTVYVTDTIAPLITYSFTNLTLSGDASCQALMPDVTDTNYLLAEDSCSSALTVTQTPTNNALLNLGTNEVVLAVTDSAGNTAYSTNTIVVVDVTAPVVVVNGANPLTVECHTSFVDPGAGADDNCSGVVAVDINGVVNIDVPGSYLIEYSATDAAGNSATNTRVVNVVDTTGPAIMVLGSNPVTNECHVDYTDAGATASDACAGSSSISTNSTVDANVPGIYFVTYTSDDGNGNTNTATRTVYVVDTIAPLVTVLGSNPYTNFAYVPFVDPGATAVDACDVTASVATNGVLDVTTPGSYTLEYIGTDASGNASTNTRLVQVIALTAPTITSQQKLGSGAFEVTFTGPRGQPYRLLSSTSADLPMASWTSLTSGAFGETPVVYTDDTATGDPLRFYRVVSP